MYQRLTERARMALDLAEEIAREAGEALVVPEHLLSAVLRLPDSGAVAALRRLGVEIDSLARSLAEGRSQDAARREMVTLDPSAMRIVSIAHIAANEAKRPEIGTEHLVLAMARFTRHPVSQWLSRAGATADDLAQAIVDETRVETQVDLGAGLLAIRERRGALDLLALIALADLPSGPSRSEIAALRAELELDLLHQPAPRNRPHAIGEAMAAAAALAADRRETLHAGHLVVAIASIEGTRLREVLRRREIDEAALIRLLIDPAGV